VLPIVLKILLTLKESVGLLLVTTI